ncbi:MAG: DUF58 domain-containing protein [Clostridia bacterium]|nr:DUF58 domain-containing protein [Clostridia bacterium]
MTGRTAAFLTADFALWLAALSTGSSVFYLFALAMGAMLLLAFLSVFLAAATAKITVRCAGRTCERGGRIPFEAEIVHFCPFPLARQFLLVQNAADSTAQIEWNAPAFAPRKRGFTVDCPHRGVYEIGVRAYQVEDIFSLFSFRRTLKAGRFTVEVRPRTADMESLPPANSDESLARYTRMTEDLSSPAGVRGWVSGDALKKVHWKLSVRKRELLVRTYEESLRPDTLVLPDLTPLNALKSHMLTIEDAVCEAAAGAANAHLKEGWPVRMPLLCAHPMEISGTSAGDLPRFLKALAQVRFDSPVPYEQTILSASARLQRTGGMVLITPRISARIADTAIRFSQMGLQTTFLWISDSRRNEAMDLLSRLHHANVRILRLDPWSGTGATAIVYEENYD